MILSELLYGAEVLKWDADPSSEIGGIASDSRKIKEGYAFVALRGTRYDGNEFVADAARRGAAVIVTDRPGERGIPSVLVKNARSAEAFMWNNAAGDPTRGMTVIAVTGTNGKTSTCFMLKIPLFLPIIAFIYFMEVVSVIIQVAYYKRTKKRVFRMAPIHHHFEKCGWGEVKVVLTFTAFTVLTCVLAWFGLR